MLARAGLRVPCPYAWRSQPGSCSAEVAVCFLHPLASFGASVCGVRAAVHAFQVALPGNRAGSLQLPVQCGPHGAPHSASWASDWDFCNCLFNVARLQPLVPLLSPALSTLLWPAHQSCSFSVPYAPCLVVFFCPCASKAQTKRAFCIQACNLASRLPM